MPMFIHETIAYQPPFWFILIKNGALQRIVNKMYWTDMTTKSDDAKVVNNTKLSNVMKQFPEFKQSTQRMECEYINNIKQLPVLKFRTEHSNFNKTYIICI